MLCLCKFMYMLHFMIDSSSTYFAIAVNYNVFGFTTKNYKVARKPTTQLAERMNEMTTQLLWHYTHVAVSRLKMKRTSLLHTCTSSSFGFSRVVAVYRFCSFLLPHYGVSLSLFDELYQVNHNVQQKRLG